MFLVRIDRGRDLAYVPLTVNVSRYLYDFAALIARSVPDAVVHARLGQQIGDEVVFLGKDIEQVGTELF